MAKAAKAIYGGVTASLTALGTVLVGDIGFGDVTAGQWVAVVVAGLVVGGGVYRIPNAPPAE